jgi:hypothetical protein
MSTLVQIKRSTSNVAPASLLEGELAYSYVSNTLFIGDTANAAINIGGNFYTTMLDERSAANGAGTLVIREANGTAQFAQLDILVSPTANSHVATKEYVDTAVLANVTLASLNDVDIGTAFSDQNNKILIGNSAGYYVGTNVTGNVSLSNTGVFTIGDGQVTNAMLVNSNVSVTAGAGLGGGGTVDLGSSITIDVVAGDGISNANGDSVSVDSTVVRTDRNQTVNGSLTFANTIYFTQDIDVTGNIYLNGNTTYINVATLNITDPLIYLASNNDTSDIVDIGFMGGKNTSGTYSHTGLIRHAADGNWYLFDGLVDEGHENNIVDVANTTYATLKANINAQQVNTGILNVATEFVTVDLTVTGNSILQGTLNVASTMNVNSSAWISDLTLGTALGVGSGGTGLTSFTANGVFFADTSSSLSFATGTEGEVLQITSGVPTFGMLDGGSF